LKVLSREAITSGNRVYPMIQRAWKNDLANFLVESALNYRMTYTFPPRSFI
jgi:hypothetical protein